MGKPRTIIMKYGHIVLANSKKGFIAQAIKKFTQSQFSHSFVTTPDMLKVPLCIEAASGGVDFTKFDTSYEQNQNEGYEVWEIRVPKETKKKAIVSILRDLEISYGIFQYPFFIFRRICLFFGKDIKSWNNFDHRGMICSQLCVAYIKACGLEKTLKGYGNGSIAPQDLQNIFKAHPKLFRLVQSVRM
jgi:hypothetical protein